MSRLCAKPSGCLSPRPHLASHATESYRWSAIQHRQRSANSEFWYGVTTTRIYCRPTCLGRIPRRDNTVFFDDLVSARASGYRACKRCKPDDETWSRDMQGVALIQRGKALIAETIAQHRDWTVSEIAEELGIGAAHFHRLFKKHLGTTPKLFALSLQARTDTTDVSYECDLSEYDDLSLQSLDAQLVPSQILQSTDSAASSSSGLISPGDISGCQKKDPSVSDETHIAFCGLQNLSDSSSCGVDSVMWTDWLLLEDNENQLPEAIGVSA